MNINYNFRKWLLITRLQGRSLEGSLVFFSFHKYKRHKAEFEEGYDSAPELDADIDDTSESSALHETGSITPFD